MKKGFKKLGAVLLTVAMALAMNSTVFAAPSELEENSEAGVAGNWDNADTERVQERSINLKKEIKVYNPNGSDVFAPIVTYTYTVTPVTTSKTITDEATDHNPNQAVTVSINDGITTNLVVTGTAAGSAGTAASAVGTLVFSNSTIWSSAAAGDVNEYDINLDFENVAFPTPGVYRYQIAETISAASYDAIAMEDGAFDIVYLDVYVDGNLDIYGYVCLTEEASVTPSTSTKINGFVTGSSDGADKYYTYDLVLSKDVANDTYGATNTAYPFTLTFSNPESYTSTFTISQTVGTGSTGLTSLTGLPTAWSGDVLVADGNATVGTHPGDVVIKGIPAGVDVNVYETNNVTGVTYSVETEVNGASAASDDSVATGATSTAVDVNTTKIATTAQQTVLITNTLLLISPTGFVVRFAPYMLVLMGGIFLIVLGVVLYKRTNKEEA